MFNGDAGVFKTAIDPNLCLMWGSLISVVNFVLEFCAGLLFELFRGDDYSVFKITIDPNLCLNVEITYLVNVAFVLLFLVWGSCWSCSMEMIVSSR